MTGLKISPREFLATVGGDDWRVVGDGASASFRIPTFAVGAQFVQAVGELPGLDGHTPDIDLRREAVTVRLVTVTGDAFGLTARDLELARQISTLARDLGVRADPTVVQNVQICLDALVIPEVLPFWRAVLGYTDRLDSPDDLIDPRRRGPLTYFQQMDEPRPQRNRIHLDIWVAHDQAEARVAAAIAAGGHLVTDKYAPSWWVLADAEGNEACVCTWQDQP